MHHKRLMIREVERRNSDTATARMQATRLPLQILRLTQPPLQLLAGDTPAATVVESCIVSRL